MLKIALWFLSTVSVVVLLFGYHTSTEGATATSPPAIYSSTPSTTPTATPSTSSTSTTKSKSGTKATATPSASATTQPATTTKTATGDVADTQWGPVQVELTVAGGSITKVDVLQYPSGNGRDDEINSYALPILIQETMSAQSAQIDMVSGATVTSGGYLTSLQSALDNAGLGA